MHNKVITVVFVIIRQCACIVQYCTYIYFIGYTIFLATTTQDSVKSDHSYFKTSEPSSSKDIDGADEQSKRKKGRPRKYHIDSPSSNSSSKMSSKMQTTLDKKTISVNHNNKQGNASKKVTVTPSKRPQAGRQRSRYLNCGNCVNCCKEDCGKCLSCKDKPKFGGNNTRKQRCVERICLHKVSRNVMTRLAFFLSL